MISGLEDLLKGSPELIAGDQTAAAAQPLTSAEEMKEDDKKPKKTGKPSARKSTA